FLTGDGENRFFSRLLRHSSGSNRLPKYIAELRPEQVRHQEGGPALCIAIKYLQRFLDQRLSRLRKEPLGSYARVQNIGTHRERSSRCICSAVAKGPVPGDCAERSVRARFTNFFRRASSSAVATF